MTNLKTLTRSKPEEFIIHDQLVLALPWYADSGCSVHIDHQYVVITATDEVEYYCIKSEVSRVSDRPIRKVIEK